MTRNVLLGILWVQKWTCECEYVGVGVWWPTAHSQSIGGKARSPTDPEKVSLIQSQQMPAAPFRELEREKELASKPSWKGANWSRVEQSVGPCNRPSWQLDGEKDSQKLKEREKRQLQFTAAVGAPYIEILACAQGAR